MAALPHKWRKRLATWPQDTPLDEERGVTLMDTTMPTLSDLARKNLLDAMALAGYQAQTQVPA